MHVHTHMGTLFAVNPKRCIAKPTSMTTMPCWHHPPCYINPVKGVSHYWKHARSKAEAASEFEDDFQADWGKTPCLTVLA